VARFSVQIKPSARKELESLDDHLLAVVLMRIEALAEDPRPDGCKKLRCWSDLWRLRVREYRIVYTIDDAARLVTVFRVRHRRDVYR
jgi:mRNA interferase RelE/StbE